LAVLEGLGRGPAGNTSLAAAFAIAQELDEEQIVVVQETEYTGAGKHPIAQLNLAKRMGIEVRRGNPRGNEPGRRIVIPEHPSQIEVAESTWSGSGACTCSALESVPSDAYLGPVDIEFLSAETRTTPEHVRRSFMSIERPDDFELRRAPLRSMSDDELRSRFWALAERSSRP
jgi:hypothetical protein